MTNSKNPCWFENIGKKDLLRCVPYFYIAGVAECGTSDLMTRLLMHPNVMRGSEKAYHWWDRLRYGASATLRFTREHKRTESECPGRLRKEKRMSRDFLPVLPAHYFADIVITGHYDDTRCGRMIINGCKNCEENNDRLWSHVRMMMRGLTTVQKR